MCGLDAGAAEKRRRGALAGENGRKRRSAARKGPAPAREAPEGQEEPLAREGAVNQPLTFALKLDPDHPYLRSRGEWLTPALVERFGLGFCSRGSMQGRICIPIHNQRGELVAYAGRWPDDEPPSDEEKYRLPRRFQKNLVLFNHHRAAALGGAHVIVVDGYFGALRLEAVGIPAVAVMSLTKKVPVTKKVPDTFSLLTDTFSLLTPFPSG